MLHSRMGTSKIGREDTVKQKFQTEQSSGAPGEREGHGRHHGSKSIDYGTASGGTNDKALRNSLAETAKRKLQDANNFQRVSAESEQRKAPTSL